jgi:TRAP-type C4-dicarboxylate transport system permease small subunit
LPDNNTSGFETGIKRTSNILVYVCMGMLLVMMFLGTADVVGRYLFNKPILGTVEIFEILLPGIVLLGLAYTQLVKAHVRVELFYSRFRPKRQAVVGLAITLWTIILFAIIAWRGTVLAISYWRYERMISNIQVPMYLVQLLVPLGALAIILVLVVDVLHFLAEMRKVD